MIVYVDIPALLLLEIQNTFDIIKPNTSVCQGEKLEQSHVCLQIFLLESRHGAAKIIARKGHFIKFPCQKALAQRRKGGYVIDRVICS